MAKKNFFVGILSTTLVHSTCVFGWIYYYCYRLKLNCFRLLLDFYPGILFCSRHFSVGHCHHRQLCMLCLAPFLHKPVAHNLCASPLTIFSMTSLAVRKWYRSDHLRWYVLIGIPILSLTTSTLPDCYSPSDKKCLQGFGLWHESRMFSGL